MVWLCCGRKFGLSKILLFDNGPFRLLPCFTSLVSQPIESHFKECLQLFQSLEDLELTLKLVTDVFSTSNFDNMGLQISNQLYQLIKVYLDFALVICCLFLQFYELSINPEKLRIVVPLEVLELSLDILNIGFV